MKERIKTYKIHIYIGQLALLAVLSAGWWGMLYPNFSMTEGTFQVVDEEGGTDGAEQTPEKEGRHGPVLSGAEGFFAMLEAEPDELEIKSRLLETISGDKRKRE